MRNVGHPQLLREVEGLPAPRGSPWRPEVGLVSAACTSGHTELAALQLAVMCADASASVRARVEPTSPLLVDGWLVPVQGDVVVQADVGGMSIKSGLGAVSFRTEGRRLVGASPDSGSFWRVNPTGSRQPRYVIESPLSFSSGIFPWPVKFAGPVLGKDPQDSVPMSRSMDALSRAMVLIDETSAGYAEWIGSATDGLVLAAGPVRAGISSPDFPGLVALSSLGDELDHAEAIVAEACHQYLFQLLLVTPLTEAGVEEIHYIPVKRSYLTTRRALVAAHAHVNVILMLRQLEKRPEHHASAKLRIARHQLTLDTDCMPALRASKQLTEAGRELYLRVQELVAA